MRTLFDGEVHVAYGQLYVESRIEPEDGTPPELHDCFTGQRSGLCGAAVPGHLFLITGTHTGTVRVTVERHGSAPEPAEGWEDVVEVSFTPSSSQTLLLEWGDEERWGLDLPVTDYRVRYLCRNLDDGDDARPEDDTLSPDEYLVQFWPAPPRPDELVRQGSHAAEYWHRFAAGLSPSDTAETRPERLLSTV